MYEDRERDRAFEEWWQRYGRKEAQRIIVFEGTAKLTFRLIFNSMWVACVKVYAAK